MATTLSPCNETEIAVTPPTEKCIHKYTSSLIQMLSSLASGCILVMIRIRTCTFESHSYWQNLLHNPPEILLLKSLPVTTKLRKTRKLELTPWDLTLFNSLKDLLVKHRGVFPKAKFHLEFHTEFLIINLQYLANLKVDEIHLAEKPLCPWGNFKKVYLVQQNHRSYCK